MRPSPHQKWVGRSARPESLATMRVGLRWAGRFWCQFSVIGRTSIIYAGLYLHQSECLKALTNGVAFQIDSWNFELTLFAFDTKSHLFRPFSCIMNSF
jgi:hypothetical protein